MCERSRRSRPEGAEHISPGQSVAPPWVAECVNAFSPEGGKQDDRHHLLRPFRAIALGGNRTQGGATLANSRCLALG